MMAPKDLGLTQKQESFCLAFIETGNASEAFRRAYPAAQKWKDGSVHVNASKMLADNKVSLRVQDLRAAAAERVVVDEVRVIEEIARVGLVDPARLFDANGTLLPIREMPAEVRAAIASIDLEEMKVGDGEVVTRIRRVKLWDKNSALEKLMKHLGQFDRHNRQKEGPFSGVPREVLRLIQEKLSGMVKHYQEQR